ncbi:MAG TPA: DUF89 family protein [Thermoprotei archaeon]|nr:MAG: hypothetical protein DRJ63_01480 [Thermoprotei archaeon]HDI74652.1 DUF89 family protein [Thermoprotei archaeon]
MRREECVHVFISTVCLQCLGKLAYYFVSKTSLSEEEKIRAVAWLFRKIAELFEGDLSDYMKMCASFYSAVFEVVGEEDFFAEEKKLSNELALKLTKIAEDYAKSLRGSIKVSAVGNALDFGTGVYECSIEDFKKRFLELIEEDFAVDDYDKFLEDLKKSKTILYVLDNAGEAVFDLLLVKRLKDFAEKIVVAARDKPVQNDVTYEEALELGFGDVAEVVSTGSRIPGLYLKTCSRDFIELLEDADLVILKGQGNYQSIDEVKRVRSKPTYAILRAKCPPVARALGVRLNSFIFKKLL